jgi:gliding motility-associated-like protein
MIVYNLSGTFTVSVTVSNSLCSSTATDTVLVSGYPVANIQPLIIQNDKGRVCIGDSILFRATVSAENDIYIWNPMQWFEYRNVSWAYGVVNEPGFVYLLVSNEFGCKSYDSVYIDAKPCCTITFPSAFTPNRDGQNDLFRPIGSHYKIHNLEIQNRWGQTIYSSSSNNPEWDGTFLGIPCDIGTYFYFVYYDCNGVQLSQKGDISLIR